MKVKIAITLTISAVFLSGCQQRGNAMLAGSAAASTDSSPDGPIRTAIQAHLAHNTNLRSDAFDMQLKQVTYDGDHANAQVEFHARNGGGTMQLAYALAKQNGAWSVIESTPQGSSFSHPGLNSTQASSPSGQASGGSDIFQVLDKLHDGVPAPAASQTLPPGHPAVSAPRGDKQQ
jgi:hypothetical protein